MASLLPKHTPRPSSALTLRRTVSGLALLAGSFGLASIATPAAAQCVEAPANVYTCSGPQDSTQTMSGPTVSILTAPGFTVDTISNGGGSTFEVTGQGTVSYVDQNASRLAGGGAYFTSVAGNLLILSNGEINSDLGLRGLGLETLSGGDINVTWTGHIDNASGDGVRAVGGGDINLVLGSVTAQDHAVDIVQNGAGGVSLVATGDLIAQNGRGVNVVAGAGSTGNIVLDLAGVSAGGRGVNVVNQGAGATHITASGAISGVLGLRLTNDIGSGELMVDVQDIYGEDVALFGVNSGLSDTVIRARDVFSASTGLQMTNSDSAGDLVITVRNVFAGLANDANGVTAQNWGLGDTVVTVEGTVQAGAQAVSVYHTATAEDVAVWTQGEVSGGLIGIRVFQDGAGSVDVQADETVAGLAGDGIRITTDTLATAVNVSAADLFGGENGLHIQHAGSGDISVIAGSVIGEQEAGAHVSTSGQAGDISLDLLAVAGDDFGVLVDNAGTGGSVIRVGGPVFANGVGIQAENGAGAGELFIDVSDVTGADHAIVAINNGVTGTFVRTHDLISNGTGLSVNNGATAGDVTVVTRDVQAGAAGIVVTSDGAFAETSVTVEGAVLALQGDGVYVGNAQQNQSIDIDVRDVHAGDNGVVASHSGTGVVDVLATGTVIGAGGDGVRVTAGELGAGVTVTTAAVAGGQSGLDIVNNGGGDTLVSATGAVVGEQQDGVRISNDQSAGALIIDVRSVQGGDTGIYANQNGAGVLHVNATSTVTGVAGNGMFLMAGDQTSGVNVTTSAVSGALNGLDISNSGFGDTVIAATGAILGETYDGLTVRNQAGAGGMDIDVRTVQGGDNGIVATQNGSGAVQVNATGALIGVAGDGLRINAGAESTDVTVTAAAALGAMNGLNLLNLGTGDTVVTATDWVVGEQMNGLQINNGQTAGAVVIDIANARGGLIGVSSLNQGSAETSVTVRGLVEGALGGILASSLGGGSIHIDNLGTIRGDLASPASTAFRASTAGSVTLSNEGLLIGTAELFAGESLLFNTGTWLNADGESLFEGGDDWVVNTAGAQIIAAIDGAAAETTAWTGLETFTNDAVLSMLDGGAGDVLVTSATTTFQTASVLGVDFGGTSSDTYRTEGALHIQPGARLALNQTGELTLYHRYVVAEGLQGVSGAFDFDDLFLTAFAGLRDGYTDTQAYVEFGQLRALADAALTPNQIETAEGADSLPDGAPVKNALLLLPDDAAAQEAFDLLSGEIHPSVRTAMIEDGRIPKAAVLERLADDPEGAGVWGRALGSFGQSDGDWNAAKADRDTKGLMAGADRAIGRLTAGVAVTWLQSDIDLERRGSSGDVETFQGLAYVGGRFGPWGMRGGVGYARSSVETERRVGFPGFSETPAATYDGSLLQGFVEAGYRSALGGGVVEPFAGVAVVHAETEGFVEDGGSSALIVEEASETSTVSTLGLRFETNPLGGLTLRGEAGWRHAWGDLGSAGVHAFDGGAPFTIVGAPLSEDAAVARMEARWRLSPRASVGIAWDGVLGSDGEDHAITGSFRVAF